MDETTEEYMENHSDTKDVITFVGSITPEDVRDGTVLVFRISDRQFPQHMMKGLTEQITRSVQDLWKGQVKAIIIPEFIEVTMLKELLKEHTDTNVQ